MIYIKSIPLSSLLWGILDALCVVGEHEYVSIQNISKCHHLSCSGIPCHHGFFRLEEIQEGPLIRNCLCVSMTVASSNGYTQRINTVEGTVKIPLFGYVSMDISSQNSKVFKLDMICPSPEQARTTSSICRDFHPS